MGKFVVEVIDLQLIGTDWKWKRIGQIDSYLSLDVISRFNDVATFTLRVMAGTPQAQLLQPGRGVVIWYEDLEVPLLSGPLRSFQRWSDDTNTGPGSIDWSGFDFNVFLQETVCFPAPLYQVGSDLKQGTRSGNVYTNPVTYGYDGTDVKYSIERFFQQTAMFNMGSDNQAGRARRGCHFLPDVSFTPATQAPFTSYKLRFELLLDAFKQRAETPLNDDGSLADPYGFQMSWNPVLEKVELDLYRPRQRGELVRFSRELGNLQRFNYTLKASKANRIIMGLNNEQEDGTDGSEFPESRNFVLGANGINPYVWNNTAYGTPDDEWGNVSEFFSDRRDLNLLKDGAVPTAGGLPVNMTNVNVDAIAQAVQQDLTDNAPVASISIEPIDTVGCRFGRDYYLGDHVTYIEDDEEITDVLREIHITDSPDSGTTVIPTIGSGDASETPALYQEVRKIWERLRKLGTVR